MATRITSLCIDANDPEVVAGFWAAALGWSVTDVDPAGEVLTVSAPDAPFDLDVCRVPEPKAGKNRLHLDLVADSFEHRAAWVEQLIGLGARHVDIGQGDDPDADWTVLADPEGNELCVVVRGEFLATVAGPIGSVVFEPASYPAVGRFWSEATGWPIVFDDTGDLAIRHPDGTGPFLTFGPPTGQPKAGKNRLHVDVSPFAGDDQAAEVERLLTAGAHLVDVGQGDVPWIVLADPDGNELCVLTPR